jgi:transposase
VLLVEHRTHRLHCPGCATRTTAQLPSGIGGSAFGPNLRAALVTLTARNRVSRRGMIELARDLFGVSLSTGTVDAICQRASGALAGPHAQLHDWVLDQAAVHVDETGWRTAGDGRALWTLSTPGAALFQIACHRNRQQFQALIGPYPGIVISDRWVGFEHLDPDRRQVCWSHYADLRVMPTRLAESFGVGRIWPMVVGIIRALRGRRGARRGVGSDRVSCQGAWFSPALAL